MCSHMEQDIITACDLPRTFCTCQVSVKFPVQWFISVMHSNDKYPSFKVIMIHCEINTQKFSYHTISYSSTQVCCTYIHLATGQPRHYTIIYLTIINPQVCVLPVHSYKSTKVMSKLMMSFSYVTVKVVHRYRIQLLMSLNASISFSSSINDSRHHIMLGRCSSDCRLLQVRMFTCHQWHI